MALQTRNASGDEDHKALRSSICQPISRQLWTPSDAITFVPALCDAVWGDGRALLGLTTINNRPAFYVIRIDSRIDIGSDMDAPKNATEFWEILDDVIDALEEQFGDGSPGLYNFESRESADYEMTDEEWEFGDPWPAFDSRDGSMWWRMDWPEGAGPIEPHPYSRRYMISALAKDPQP